MVIKTFAAIGILALSLGMAHSQATDTPPDVTPDGLVRMSRQERREVLGHRDRTHAGAAAAVRDAEGLVQVQVADVGTVVPGSTQPHLGVHVRAVEIDLSTVLVNDRADLLDRGLEHAVRRRVSHHQGGELVRVFFGLRP